MLSILNIGQGCQTILKGYHPRTTPAKEDPEYILYVELLNAMQLQLKFELIFT
jgi:hypothetical protein